MNHDMSRSAIENGPDIEEDDGDLFGNCPRCNGAGGWSWTVEGPDGRDIEDEHDCHYCGGTGKA